MKHYGIIITLPFSRDPTPEFDIPTPPDSNEPVNWEKATPTSQHYLYLENTQTSMRGNYRALESSFWRNYFFTIAQGWDLHDDLTPGIPSSILLPLIQYFIQQHEHAVSEIDN